MWHKLLDEGGQAGRRAASLEGHAMVDTRGFVGRGQGPCSRAERWDPVLRLAASPFARWSVWRSGEARPEGPLLGDRDSQGAVPAWGDGPSSWRARQAH